MKWIPRSKSGASKSRPRWAAHTHIGNVWEYPPGFSINLEPPVNSVKCRKFSWSWILIEGNQTQKEKNRRLMFHPAVLDKP